MSKLHTYSELEIQVIADMFNKGFDALNKEDVKRYWAQRLGDETGG